MTIAELKEECDRVRRQGLKSIVLRIERHGGSWMQVMKGLMGNVVGSDKHGSFVAVSIAKAEAKIAGMDPATEIPRVTPHKARVLP